MLHSLNSAEIHSYINTGLMRTMRKSERCLTRSASPLQPPYSALGGWPPPRKSVWRMKGRGTVDMVFATRLLQEQRQEQNKGLYKTIVDLTKACDTVSCKRACGRSWQRMAV